MNRVKLFKYRIDVSNAYLKAEPEQARADAERMVLRGMTSPVRGPRGGRYLPVGEPSSVQSAPSPDFAMDVTIFWASGFAKYVRPSRHPEPQP